MTISWLPRTYLVNPHFFATVMNEDAKLSFFGAFPPRRMKVDVFADSR